MLRGGERGLCEWVVGVLQRRYRALDRQPVLCGECESVRGGVIGVLQRLGRALDGERMLRREREPMRIGLAGQLHGTLDWKSLLSVSDAGKPEGLHLDGKALVAIPVMRFEVDPRRGASEESSDAASAFG